MYASHKQLLRSAQELRHRRNLVSEWCSSAKVQHSPPLFFCYFGSLVILQTDTEKKKLVEVGAEVKQKIAALEVVK